MARVFISHAGEDRALAAEVFGWLSGEGHALFYDRDLSAGLTVGEQWELRLFERLRWADAVVCLITARYVASPWCSAEVGIAIARGSRLLPVVGEPGAVHPLLRGTQHADYSKDPSAARAALGAALTELDNAGGRGWVDGRSPFPGLRAFDSDMHGVYFGRRREAQRLVELLRSPAESADRGLLVVTGPSGCGKSSLVRAGLLPEMADEPGWWTLPAVRPGADPLAALAGEVTAAARRLGLVWDLPHVRDRFEGPDPAGVFDELLLAVPGNVRRRHLLVVVDQLEELLTRTPVMQQAGLARLLHAAMAGPVQVVGTLRSEYLAPLLANENLTGVPIRTFAMRPLAPEALPEVIRGPADIAGIDVAPELVTRLVADTGTGEALPLLAFTLQQLAADVARGGRLSLPQYELLGGVQGALTSQADMALADAIAATHRTAEQVIAGLLRLVTVDEQGRPTRIRVPVDDLPEVVRTELAVFTARRLLTTDTENDAAVIGVAHEAFLSGWAPLRQAISAAAAALRARHAVEQAAIEWNSTGRPRNRLWERGRLAAARNDLEEPHHERPQQTVSPGSERRRRIPASGRLYPTKVDLSGTARSFLRTSIRTDRRRRARAISILSVLLLAAASFAVVALGRGDRLAEQLVTANAETLGAQALARALDDPVGATQLALTAWRSDPKSPTARAALAQRYMAMRSVDAVFPDLAPHPISRVQPAKNADIAILQHASGDTVIQGLSTGRPERWELPGAPAGTEIRISPNGATAAGIDSDDRLLLWDLTHRGDPATLLEGAALGTQSDFLGNFSTDGTRLAVVTPSDSPDGPVLSVWDVQQRTLVGRLTALGSGRSVAHAWFSDDPGRVLIETYATTDGRDRRVTLRSVADGAVISEFGPDALPVQNGSSLLTCANTDSTDSRPIVITATDTGTVRAHFALPGYGSCSWASVTLTADGDHVITGSSSDDAPYWQMQVTSLTTAATYDVVVPPGRNLSLDGVEDFAAVDAPDGTLTAVVARGMSLLRLTGGPRDWTADGRFTQSTKFQASDDRRHIVVAPFQSAAAVYDRESGAQLAQSNLGRQQGSDTSNDDIRVNDAVWRFFTDAAADDQVKLTEWTLPNLTPAAQYTFHSSSSASHSKGVLIPDDQNQRLYALIGSNHELSIWDTRTHLMIGEPAQIGSTRPDQSDFTDPYFSRRPGHPDQLVSSSADGKLVVWGIDERRELATLPAQVNFDNAGSFQVDPSGNRVAVLTPTNTIELWDIDSGQLIHSGIPAPHAKQIIGFTADGYIVTADGGSPSPRMIQFWDPDQSGLSAEIALPPGSSGFTAGQIVDGQRLGIDTLGVMPFDLDMTGQQWFTALCAINDREFTDAERQLLPAGTSDHPPCSQ